MYLIDTDVVSEARKHSNANPGVRSFLDRVISKRDALFLSVVTVGELRRSVEKIRRRGCLRQAGKLEHWLENILVEYPEQILEFGPDIAQLWGAIRLPETASVLDRQVAATARIHGLTLVTRKASYFAGSGVSILNPFSDIP